MNTNILQILINNKVFKYMTNNRDEDLIVLCNSDQARDIWAVLPSSLHRLSMVICAQASTEPILQVMSSSDHRKEFIANLTKVLATIKAKLIQSGYVLKSDFQVEICQDLTNISCHARMFLFDPWPYQVDYRNAQLDEDQIVIRDTRIPQECNERVAQAQVVISNAMSSEEFKDRTKLALQKSGLVFNKIVEQARQQVKFACLDEMYKNTINSYSKFFGGLCCANVALAAISGAALQLSCLEQVWAGSVAYLVTGTSLWLLCDKNKIIGRFNKANHPLTRRQLQCAWLEEVLHRMAFLLLVISYLDSFAALATYLERQGDGSEIDKDNLLGGVALFMISLPFLCRVSAIILASKHDQYMMRTLERTNLLSEETPYQAPQLQDLLECWRPQPRLSLEQEKLH